MTPNNLATLLNCSLKSQRPSPVVVWKLLFQKASPVLDQALDLFATMVAPSHTHTHLTPPLCQLWVQLMHCFQLQAPNASNPSLSHALEALAEVRLSNFTQAQLRNDTFVRSWFHARIAPLLASSSSNFLFCLSTKNFSCRTYHTA